MSLFPLLDPPAHSLHTAACGLPVLLTSADNITGGAGTTSMPRVTRLACCPLPALGEDEKKRWGDTWN